MRPNITITTVTNGYALSIDRQSTKKDYLYFSVRDLMDGFFYHVGLEEQGAMDMEKMKALLETAVRWHDNKALIRELVRKDEEIQGLNDKLEAQCHKIDRLERSVNHMKAKIGKEKGQENVEEG